MSNELSDGNPELEDLSSLNLTDDERREVEGIIAGLDNIWLGEELLAEDDAGTGSGSAQNEEEEQDKRDIRARIGEMTLPQKIKLAMFGNAICRSLLISAPNRMIPIFVLKNPKLQIGEVETFANNSNLNEQVLRYIADKKEWIKEYSVKYNIVTNPKTPPAVALKWLRYLQVNDLKKISKSRNVPQVVAVTAKKRLAEKQKR